MLSDENLPSSCSPSPPLVITQPIRPQKRATISREAQNFNEDIARLQKEALEAQIAKVSAIKPGTRNVSCLVYIDCVKPLAVPY